jgi:hypothetical protein
MCLTGLPTMNHWLDEVRLLLITASRGFVSDGYDKVYAATEPQPYEELFKITLTGYPHQTYESETIYPMRCDYSPTISYCTSWYVGCEIYIPGIGSGLLTIHTATYTPSRITINFDIRYLQGQTGPAGGNIHNSKMLIPGIGQGLVKVQCDKTLQSSPHPCSND